MSDVPTNPEPISNQLVVRDHRRACEHPPEFSGNILTDGSYQIAGVWFCDAEGCPGGKKIVLRETTIKDMRLKADTPIWVAVEAALS